MTQIIQTEIYFLSTSLVFSCFFRIDILDIYTDLSTGYLFGRADDTMQDLQKSGTQYTCHTILFSGEISMGLSLQKMCFLPHFALAISLNCSNCPPTPDFHHKKKKIPHMRENETLKLKIENKNNYFLSVSAFPRHIYWSSVILWWYLFIHFQTRP